MQRTRANRRTIITNVIFLSSLIALLLLDQILKTVFKNLYENTSWNETTIIQGFFSFKYTMNTGSAFSFLSDTTWGQTFFKVLTAVALVLFFIFYLYVSKKNLKWLRWALILVIAGTIGNFIDRLAYNGVVDFISFIFGDYHFPIFNFADIYLTIGVIMIVVYYLFLDKDALFKKSPKKETEKDANTNN